MGEGEVTARVRERYPAATVTGLDLPDPALASPWRAGASSGCSVTSRASPSPSGAFDLVLAIEVLEHVPDPAAGLAELARVSRGDLVVSVPREPIWRVANMARGKYLGALGNTPGHVQHWSRRGFARFVASQVDVVTVRAPFPWTMVAARVR